MINLHGLPSFLETKLARFVMFRAKFARTVETHEPKETPTVQIIGHMKLSTETRFCRITIVMYLKDSSS